MPELGRLAICLALMCALFSIGASIRGALTRRADIVRAGTHAAWAVFGLVALAVVLLLRALLTHDFSLEYVAAYSSSTLPTNYVVAAGRRARCSSGRSCCRSSPPSCSGRTASGTAS